MKEIGNDGIKMYIIKEEMTWLKLPKMELTIICGIQSSKDAVFNTLAVKEIGGLDRHFINHVKRFCSIYADIRTWR